MPNSVLTALMMAPVYAVPLSDRNTAGNPARSKKTDSTKNFAHSSSESSHRG